MLQAGLPSVMMASLCSFPPRPNTGYSDNGGGTGRAGLVHEST